jgi:hypothetical protein
VVLPPFAAAAAVVGAPVAVAADVADAEAVGSVTVPAELALALEPPDVSVDAATGVEEPTQADAPASTVAAIAAAASPARVLEWSVRPFMV